MQSKIIKLIFYDKKKQMIMEIFNFFKQQSKIKNIKDVCSWEKKYLNLSVLIRWM